MRMTYSVRPRPSGLAVGRRVELVDEVREAEELLVGVPERDVEVAGVDEVADEAVDGRVELAEVPGLVRGLRHARPRLLEGGRPLALEGAREDLREEREGRRTVSSLQSASPRIVTKLTTPRSCCDARTGTKTKDLTPSVAANARSKAASGGRSATRGTSTTSCRLILATDHWRSATLRASGGGRPAPSSRQREAGTSCSPSSLRSQSVTASAPRNRPKDSSARRISSSISVAVARTNAFDVSRTRSARAVPRSRAASAAARRAAGAREGDDSAPSRCAGPRHSSAAFADYVPSVVRSDLG